MERTGSVACASNTAAPSGLTAARPSLASHAVRQSTPVDQRVAEFLAAVSARDIDSTREAFGRLQSARMVAGYEVARPDFANAARDIIAAMPPAHRAALPQDIAEVMAEVPEAAATLMSIRG